MVIKSAALSESHPSSFSAPPRLLLHISRASFLHHTCRQICIHVVHHLIAVVKTTRIGSVARLANNVGPSSTNEVPAKVKIKARRETFRLQTIIKLSYILTETGTKRNLNSLNRFLQRYNDSQVIEILSTVSVRFSLVSEQSIDL